MTVTDTYLSTLTLVISLAICGSAYAESENSAQPDDALVSQADSSATVAAVANGFNPKTTIISSRFSCYNKEQLDLEQPVMFYTVEGDSVTISIPSVNGTLEGIIEPGEDTGEFIVDFQKLKPGKFRLEFNDFGQEIYAINKGGKSSGCFQEGPAHEAALHRFNLNTPKAGIFNCSDSGEGSSISIEILGANRYQVGSSTGNISLETVTVGHSSKVLFSSGPLKGLDAKYSEDPSTGTQVFQLSRTKTKTFVTGQATSSKALGAQCVRQTTPNPYKRYGKNTAPTASQPKQSLQGRYFIDTRVATSLNREDSAEFVEFNPSGYAHFGQPVPQDNVCSLTHPNGLPICQQYDFDGRSLSVMSPWGGRETMPITATDDGALTTMGDKTVEVLAPVNPKDIVGSWDSQDAYMSNNVAACIIASCKTSITDRTLVFTKDGKFTLNIESESSNSFNGSAMLPGMASYISKGSNNDSENGSYKVSQNTLTLNTSSGAVIDLPIHVTANGNLVVGEFQYSKP